MPAMGSSSGASNSRPLADVSGVTSSPSMMLI